MLGMLAFQIRPRLASCPLRALRDVGPAGGVPRRLGAGRAAHALLLVMYA
jgi:hypothetical protein